MTEPTVTPRASFDAAAAFIGIRSVRPGLNLCRLVDETNMVGGGPHDLSVWRDWLSSVGRVLVGSLDGDWHQSAVFRMPEPRDVPDGQLASQALTLSEAFVVMAEFVWTFASATANTELDQLRSILGTDREGEVDAVAWRNWIHIVAWLLRGNALHGNSWNDVLSAALNVGLPKGVEVPASFAMVDPETYDGGIEDERAQWVHLPQIRGVSDLGSELAPLIPDLRSLVKIDGVFIDLVVWLESAGETAGVAADTAAFAELVPLIRDIWIESEPRNGRDRALRDEIVVRSSIHNQVFGSNDAGEWQDMLVTAVRDAAASSTGDMIEIELIPRAGRAGLVVTGEMLEDIAASGHGLRLVSRG